MKYLEFLELARLLLKFRASFALSRRFRDLIDEVCQECIRHSIIAFNNEVNAVVDDDLPF